MDVSGKVDVRGGKVVVAKRSDDQKGHKLCKAEWDQQRGIMHMEAELHDGDGIAVNSQHRPQDDGPSGTGRCQGFRDIPE